MFNWQRRSDGENEWAMLNERDLVSFNTNPSIGGNGPETALVIYDKNCLSNKRFLILSGDFRREYEEAFARDGLGACLRFFEENRDKENFWSDGLPNEND